jgi:TolB-like protein/DNA-binding winged helix-turn-helix (wHTH) protein
MAAGAQTAKARLDLSRYELTIERRRVQLEPQPMDLLILFVQKRGELVTREEIIAKLWGKDVFVDVDQSINAAVRKIRSALRDDPATPRYLETVIGKGYRFIGEVEIVGAAPADKPAEPSTAAGRLQPKTSHKRFLRFMFAGTAIALAIAVSVWAGLAWKGRIAGRGPEIRSVVVLPLANLSGDVAQEYFVDGMTEELTTDLAKITSLRVISRTSAEKYRGSKKSAPQIAQELKVEAIVEGSVLRSGSNVRITTQLIDAVHDKHLWADSYERDLRDVLALQREVAAAIAKQVKATLTPQEDARLSRVPQVNAQAHEAYLRGLFFWNKWTEDGVRKSIDNYQQAIQADPSYAPAFAGLANSYIAMGDFGVGLLPPNQANTAAEQAALKALSLDDTLGEAHAALAMSRFRSDRDLSGVEAEFKRALELNPGSATEHHWYSHYLLATGRNEDAIAEGQRAYDLSPIDPEMGVHMQFLYLFLHRYDDVIEAGRKTLELDRNFSETHFMDGQAYEQQHRYKEAVAELRVATDLSGRRTMILGALGHVLAVSGDQSGARRILAEFKSLSRSRYVPRYDYALIHVGLADNDAALNDLQQAYNEGSSWMFILQSDARLDPLRADSRFKDLVGHIGQVH